MGKEKEPPSKMSWPTQPSFLILRRAVAVAAVAVAPPPSPVSLSALSRALSRSPESLRSPGSTETEDIQYNRSNVQSQGTVRDGRLRVRGLCAFSKESSTCLPGHFFSGLNSSKYTGTNRDFYVGYLSVGSCFLLTVFE